MIYNDSIQNEMRKVYEKLKNIKKVIENQKFAIYLGFCECKFLVYQRHLHFEHLMKHGNPILQKPCLLGNVLVNLLLHYQNFK